MSNPENKEPVDKDKHINIHINDVEYHVTDRKMTGAELKALAQVPANHRLYEEVPGPRPDKPIDDNEVVHLKDGDHFYSIPPATKGEDLRVLPLVQSQIDRVRQDYPELVVAPQPDGSIDLELPGFELPPGWTKPQTSVMVSIPVGYPDNKPQGFFIDPDLQLASGQAVGLSGPQVRGDHNWNYFCWNSAEWDPHRDGFRPLRIPDQQVSAASPMRHSENPHMRQTAKNRIHFGRRQLMLSHPRRSTPRPGR